MFDWLDYYSTSHAAWVYLLSAELALLFSILVRRVQSKTGPQWIDVWEYLVYSIFVSMVSVLADNSPWISIAIGAGAKPLWHAFERGVNKSAPLLARRLLSSVSDEETTKGELANDRPVVK